MEKSLKNEIVKPKADPTVCRTVSIGQQFKKPRGQQRAEKLRLIGQEPVGPGVSPSKLRGWDRDIFPREDFVLLKASHD